MGRRYSLRGTHIAARSGTRAHQGDGGGPFIWLTQRRQAAKPPLRIANHLGPEGRLYGYNASKSDGYSRIKMDRLTSSCTWQLCIHSDPRWYFVGTKSAYSWPPSFFFFFQPICPLLCLCLGGSGRRCRSRYRYLATQSLD